MKDYKIWLIGLLFVLISILLGESTIILKDLIYDNNFLDRNIIILFTWSVQATSAFLVVKSAKSFSVLLGLSYIPIITIIGPAIHFLLGELGIVIDFGGVSGLHFTVKYYFIIGTLTSGFGSISAFLIKKRK